MPNYSYFNPGAPAPVYFNPGIKNAAGRFNESRQNALLMKQRAEELVYERGRDTRADERNAVADLLAQAEEERKIAKRAEDKIKAEAEGKLDAGKIQTATLKKLFNPVVISSPELSQERWASGAVAAKYPELKEFNDIMQGFAKTLPPEKFNQKVAALVEMNNEKKKETLPTTAMGKFIADNPNATSEELVKFTQQLSSAKDDPSKKKLDRLEDDIMQTIMKIASIKSGQNIMTEAYESKGIGVVEDLEKSLIGMLEIYKAQGGDLGRFGKKPPPQPSQEKIEAEAASAVLKKQQEEKLTIQTLTEQYPPEKHKGVTKIDKETNEKYTSNGIKWIKVYKIEQ